MAQEPSSAEKPKLIDRFLNTIERVGNILPDPALLFLGGMLLVWVLSAILAPMVFTEVDPRTDQVIQVKNLLTGTSLASFLASMVKTFTSFAPLGVVLVAMLGVGVAEHSGYINAGLKEILSVTPKILLTPVLILVGIISHTATDAGYVLVIPLGGIIFYAMGRHPLAGIAAAFAGVSGGFSANFIPSAIDPLLQGFTQSAAQLYDPLVQVNPLCNWYFTGISSFLIIFVGWFITDKIVEPRLQNTPVDGAKDDLPVMEDLDSNERRAFWISSGIMLLGVLLLVLAVWPSTSPMRTPDGSLTDFKAPLMQSIVPLIFLLFLLPGVTYGYLAKTFTSSKEIIASMSKAMNTMAYYIVLAFFCALFIDAFNQSNIGALIALKGAAGLKAANLAPGATITGIIFLTAMVNLLLGSASAKWGLIGPIFVPMLMALGISPELTQAAYRIGDSTTNIITPLMPYFPLVVVFCQRYVKSTGIGTLVSLMLPYCVVFLITWTLFLLAYWGLGIPLGIQGYYVYPAPAG